MLTGHKRSQPFLNIAGSVYAQGGDEQGLLGIAFPPDYTTSGRFYVYYTVPGNDIKIVQFRRSAGNANLADPASARTVLTIDHHAFTNHNGGQLAFGREGDLYIGVGDGGSEGDPDRNGQNTGTLLAKILRIAPSPNGGYTIPASNPFVGQRGKRAGDLGVRPAQPVALLLRPRDRRHGHRRRRAGSLGGARLRRRRHRRRSELRLERLGGRSAASTPARRRTRSRRFSPPRTATATARSSADTWSATGRCRACTAGTCSATSAGRRSSRSSCRAPARRGCAKPGWKCPRCRHSAGRQRAHLPRVAERARVSPGAALTRRGDRRSRGVRASRRDLATPARVVGHRAQDARPCPMTDDELRATFHCSQPLRERWLSTSAGARAGTGSISLVEPTRRDVVLLGTAAAPPHPLVRRRGGSSGLPGSARTRNRAAGTAGSGRRSRRLPPDRCTSAREGPA